MILHGGGLSGPGPEDWSVTSVGVSGATPYLRFLFILNYRVDLYASILGATFLSIVITNRIRRALTVSSDAAG